MNHNFKIGDKVRLASHDTIFLPIKIIPLNSEVIILEIDDEDDTVLVEYNNKIHWAELSCLESIEELTIDKVLKYHKIYKDYLTSQGIEETDNTLTVNKLVDFVENHILNEFN